jgi:hypothetical protein
MRRRRTFRRRTSTRWLRIPAKVLAARGVIPAKKRTTPKGKKEPSPLEERLVGQIQEAGLPAPAREHRFAAPRRWRFDFAWPDRLLAVEVQGGVFVQGKHGRGAGIAKDAEKLSHAAIRGWRVLLATAPQIRSGEAVGWVREALED